MTAADTCTPHSHCTLRMRGDPLASRQCVALAANSGWCKPKAGESAGTPSGKVVSEYFTVWRPTSLDAIRMMMSGKATGKGLNIKGKSAKKGEVRALHRLRSGPQPTLTPSRGRMRRGRRSLQS